MSKLKFIVLCLLCAATGLQAQTLVGDYEELPNPAVAPVGEWNKLSALAFGWGTTDMRYAKERPVARKDLSLKANLHGWKNETVSAQAVVSAPQGLKGLHAVCSDLSGKAGSIEARHIELFFARYVMTDELDKDGGGGCGNRQKADYDSSLVADPLCPLQSLNVEPQTTRTIWFSLHIPASTAAGTYRGTIELRDAAEATLGILSLQVEVANRMLPNPSEWAFHLDLWQNPYAVARYHGVEPFSQAHFSAMEPVMRRYAQAGGKVITASINHKPWNGQTQDHFESMITWLRRADGSWAFDYTTFDKWVEFMMRMGVTEQINCYSIIPWRLSFQYFDGASNSFKYLKAQPDSPEYREFWGRMLRDFAVHLKTKGWFEKTHIAIDERPMKAVLAALDVVKQADPDFKIAYAGHYHEELAMLIDDYCVTLLHDEFPTDVLTKRKAAGFISTYYTCCSEPRPNGFTFSPPAESEWLGWYAARENLDGYLRWALNSWTTSPFQDSRFRTWAAGDCYQLYPGQTSSIRFERLREGIQAYEKIRLLRQEFQQRNNQEGLAAINRLLEAFDRFRLDKTSAAEVVARAKKQLNNL